MKQNRRQWLAVCLACGVLFAGCSASQNDMDIPTSLEEEAQQTAAILSESENTGTPGNDAENTGEDAQADASATENTTEPVIRDLYYVTSNQTQDVADLQKCIDRIKADGYDWHEAEISEIPAKAGAILFNSPMADLNAEEYAFLEEYLNTGGRLFLLLPASDSETRYKYLDRLLEQYYIRLDYNLITDEANEQPDDYIKMQAINYPDRFVFADACMESGVVYLRNTRSFHHLPQEENTVYDAMLQTAETASGLPYGGMEDDPVIYESEKMDVMLFCREETRHNACVVVMGSADFLLDENVDSPYAQAAQYWAYSALDWLYSYARNL